MNARVRTTLVVLSFVIAGVAIALWVRTFDVTGTDVKVLLDRLKWWTIPIIFVLLTSHVALSAVRWTRIEIALGGTAPSFRRAFLSGALALGLGTFLPGPLANVACRGLSNRLNGESGTRGAIGGGLDQIADFALVLIFALPAILAFLFGSPPIYVGGALIVAFLGFLAAAGVSGIRGDRIHQLASSKWPRVAPLLKPSLVVDVYSLTLLRFVNLTAITLMIWVASGAGTFGSVLVSVPLVTLAISVTMLPGALGASEWSFTGVLGRFGVAEMDVTAFVLANRLVLTSLGLALGIIGALLSLSRYPKNETVVTRGP